MNHPTNSILTHIDSSTEDPEISSQVNGRSQETCSAEMVAPEGRAASLDKPCILGLRLCPGVEIGWSQACRRPRAGSHVPGLAECRGDTNG